MRFWTIKLSYRIPPVEHGNRYRQNGQFGIVALNIETAIHKAKGLVPDGADEVCVWGANAHGRVDVVAKD